MEAFLRGLAWELSLVSFALGALTWELSVVRFRLWALSWELYLAWALQFEIHYFGLLWLGGISFALIIGLQPQLESFRSGGWASQF